MGQCCSADDPVASPQQSQNDLCPQPQLTPHSPPLVKANPIVVKKLFVNVSRTDSDGIQLPTDEGNQSLLSTLSPPPRSSGKSSTFAGHGTSDLNVTLPPALQQARDQEEASLQQGATSTDDSKRCGDPSDDKEVSFVLPAGAAITATSFEFASFPVVDLNKNSINTFEEGQEGSTETNNNNTTKGGKCSFASNSSGNERQNNTTLNSSDLHIAIGLGQSGNSQDADDALGGTQRRRISNSSPRFGGKKRQVRAAQFSSVLAGDDEVLAIARLNAAAIQNHDDSNGERPPSRGYAASPLASPRWRELSIEHRPSTGGQSPNNKSLSPRRQLPTKSPKDFDLELSANRRAVSSSPPSAQHHPTKQVSMMSLAGRSMKAISVEDFGEFVIEEEVSSNESSIGDIHKKGGTL